MAGRRPVVGTPRPKVDAVAKVTGQTRFADDLSLPRMLWCRMLRSPHPFARITHIDTTHAAALPGVHAVLTGSALPIPFGVLPVSQDEHALSPEIARFVGDAVAAVAARDEDVAAEACRLIEVSYDPLTPVGSVSDAISRPEPQIHGYADSGNLHKVVHLEFGDLDAGLLRLFEDAQLLLDA